LIGDAVRVAAVVVAGDADDGLLLLRVDSGAPTGKFGSISAPTGALFLISCEPS
jgi:hypothetical protein